LDRLLPEGEFNKTLINVKANVKDNYAETTLSSLLTADVIILVFPLYAYGLPGALMRLLEDYKDYKTAVADQGRKTRVYVIVNCGFPNPQMVTVEALRVVQNFCKRFLLTWRFAVCIGTGPVVAMTKKVPFFDLKLKKSLVQLVADIRNDGDQAMANYVVKPIIPEAMIKIIKGHFEKKMKMIPGKKVE
jgi:hypothetical protein